MENQAIADGGKSTRRTVTITRDGQVENVTLAYEFTIIPNDKIRWNGTTATTGEDHWEYRNGQLSVTSHWTGKSDKGVGYSETPVDISGYSTLAFHVSKREGDRVWLDVTSKPNGATVATKNIPRVGDYTIDVQSLEGDVYVRLCVEAGGDYTYTSTVDSIVLS